MSNYEIKLDLLKLKGAGVARVKGKSGLEVPCLVVPIKMANLFLGEKGCYLSLNAWANRDGVPGQYGDTHGIKQSIAKETLEKMTEEERKALPFLGNMKPRAAQPSAVDNVTNSVEVAQADTQELPF